MKKCGSLMLTLMIVLFVGCATTRPAEHITFSIPKDGQPKHVKDYSIQPGEAYLTRFVWQGESIDNWTEALEVFNTWRRNFPPTVDDAYKKAIDLRKKKCPDSTFNIISQDASSILYEIRTTNCPPNPDENSLTRTIYGNNNVFSLIYTNKTKEMPKEKRDEWTTILSNARIETNK